MEINKFRSISAFHHYAHLPPPEHPLVSLIDYSKINYPIQEGVIRWIQGFYTIGVKRNIGGKFSYGQQPYDFDEGIMSFVSPKQLIRLDIMPDKQAEPTGWLLLLHPDFLWNTGLAKTIHQYDFFDYAIHEALFLSKKEEDKIITLLKTIQEEYQSVVDPFTQGIIIAQVELLLNHAQRFYTRQFITRKVTNDKLLHQLEKLLQQCFESDNLIAKGLPTVRQIATQLHLSPNYLSNMLTTLTGQSTQQHIHDKLIEKAKEKLSTTALSINEIAYELGFEHPTSFSKLFKQKTSLSPNKFRLSFQ
ncbi:MAG: helix-turn-helix domain-containing protein [Aureispira sp.]